MNDAVFHAVMEESIFLVIGLGESDRRSLFESMTSGRNQLDVEFVAVVPPRQNPITSEPSLSQDHLEKIERVAGLSVSGGHGGFWAYWCLQALVRRRPGLMRPLLRMVSQRKRAKLEAFFENPSCDSIIPVLRAKDALIDAEELLLLTDKLLVGDKSFCVAFDAEDDWTHCRDRYAVGLLQLLAQFHPRLRCIWMKVFLNADVWLGVKMQNKSHLLAGGYVYNGERESGQ
jgi:hypothetical protein